ncbi:hypothetical protein [Limnochorda pilosa]|uniref:Uncharacterized protein n=1 Tax=Limnochorda pilosa TaxID=1555112 RepID=A0A0K2SHH6_LIMPI|nr:hypothetical protein [Limnochorda pilosa]BAS26545.1 hypothetical protein LIP_0688 [Limnochorda pilosa]
MQSLGSFDRLIGQIHGILGEVLLGAAVFGILVALGEIGAGREPRWSRRFLGALSIVLALQWLLGVANYVLAPPLRRPELGHPGLMTVLVGFVQWGNGRLRRGGERAGWLVAGLLAVTAAAMYMGMQMVR